MSTVLSQAYFGSKLNLTEDKMFKVKSLFGSEEVVTKGHFPMSFVKNIFTFNLSIITLVCSVF